MADVYTFFLSMLLLVTSQGEWRGRAGKRKAAWRGTTVLQKTKQELSAASAVTVYGKNGNTWPKSRPECRVKTVNAPKREGLRAEKPLVFCRRFL